MAPAFRVALVFGALAAIVFAAEPQLEFSRLDLTDGRSLKNVAIKTYDPESDRVLLIADGKAMVIARTLVPPPFAEQLKQARRSAETVSIISTPTPSRPIAAAADQYQMTQAVPVSPPARAAANGSEIAQPTSPPPPARTRAGSQAPARPATPNQASAHVQGIDLQAHRRIAIERAQRYYRHEFRVGSDSALMMGIEIEVSPPKVVPGWEGRCRAEGKAYLEIYDSRGRSFQRRTSTFEVITERKASDEEIVIIDFTPKT